MPTEVFIPRGEVLEGNDVWLVHRVVLPDGVNVSTAEIDNNVTVRVFDLNLPQTASSNEPIFVDTAVAPGDGSTGPLFNTLQTDGFWGGLDEDGYNWRYQLLYDSTGVAGPHMIGGRQYLIEFTADAGASSSSAGANIDYGNIRWVSIINCRSASSS